MNETVAKQSGSEPDRLVDLEELRRLAEAATPGPWIAGDLEPSAVVRDGPWGTVVLRVNSPGNREDDERLAAYIAAANPATILSLLDRYELAHVDLQAAEQRVAALEEGLRDLLATFHLSEAGPFHSMWVFDRDPAPVVEQARSLLQSSAARLAPPLRGSQGDSDEPLDAVFEDRDRLQESEAHREG